MLVGLKILVIIAIMGGLIAYMGDKLGTKVGKRRMSLFGLRPKHPSMQRLVFLQLHRKAYVLRFLGWINCGQI